MINKFIDEIEELLHSKSYSSVDILPLVKKFTEGKEGNEETSLRLKLMGLIDQMKADKLVQTDNDFHFQMSAQVYGKFSEDPIYVRGTLKFEKEYIEKHKPPVQPITNNTINAGNNIGSIIQSSNLSGDFSLQINVPTITLEDEKKLKSYGLNQDEIDELRNITVTNNIDKPSLTSNLNKWLGSVLTSVTAREISIHIPAIKEFIHKML